MQQSVQKPAALGRVACALKAAGVAVALAAGLACASASHATTMILDVGMMDSHGMRVVNIAGIGATYAAPMQFTGIYGTQKVDIVAWCVDVYHHITLADYAPNLVYTDTNTLQTDFAPTPHPLDNGDAYKIGLLAHYGQDVFDDAPVAVAAFTEAKPVAPPAFTAKPPVEPKAPVAPTPPAANASVAVKAAYAIKKAAYDTAKAAYDIKKAAYVTAKAQYDAAKAGYNAALATYNAALATYNADKAAHDLAVKAYAAAVANRYTVLSAVQAAIWQVASNRDVTSANHDLGFDTLVDNLSGNHLADYFNASSEGGATFKLITPVPVFGKDGHTRLAATQSFVFAVPVPEPQTWVLMIGGFGLAGAALRRQRRRGPLNA